MYYRLLAEASPTGANALIIVGPIVIAIALFTWLGLTLYAARKRVRPERIHGRSAHRGDVQGGVIQRGPDQRTRRDEVPRG